jgi:hypothetical protein
MSLYRLAGVDIRYRFPAPHDHIRQRKGCDLRHHTAALDKKDRDNAWNYLSSTALRNKAKLALFFENGG